MLLNIDINRKVQMNISKLTLTLLLCLSVSSVVASDISPETIGSTHPSKPSSSGDGRSLLNHGVSTADSKSDNESDSKKISQGLRKSKFKFTELARSASRELVRPFVISGFITYLTRAVYNKASFVESNHKVLGCGIVCSASILLAVKKARKFLNSFDNFGDVVKPTAATAPHVPSVHSSDDAVIARAAAAASAPSLLPMRYDSDYCKPLSKRDASMLNLAHVGEAAIGINSDLLEAAVGFGAAMLAPLPSFLK